MTQESQDAITSYLTDMQALEEHLQKAFAGQLADTPNAPFGQVISRLNATSEQHTTALRDLVASRERGGQGLAGAMKKAASSVLGLGAAAIDLIRTEQVPKTLRDNYAAVSLATVGYLMLYTTAVTLHDSKVADLAHAHLANYARATMTLFHVIPESVVAFLESEGFPVREDVSAKVAEALEDVWSPAASGRA